MCICFMDLLMACMENIKDIVVLEWQVSVCIYKVFTFYFVYNQRLKIFYLSIQLNKLQKILLILTTRKLSFIYSPSQIRVQEFR